MRNIIAFVFVIQLICHIAVMLDCCSVNVLLLNQMFLIYSIYLRFTIWNIHMIIELSQFFKQRECNYSNSQSVFDGWIQMSVLLPLRLLAWISPFQNIVSSSPWVFSCFTFWPLPNMGDWVPLVVWDGIEQGPQIRPGHLSHLVQLFVIIVIEIIWWLISYSVKDKALQNVDQVRVHPTLAQPQIRNS